MFFILPVTLTGRTLAIALGLFSFLSALNSGPAQGGVAHVAHIAGGIAGYIYGLHVRGNAHYGFPTSAARGAQRSVGRVWETVSRLFTRERRVDMRPPPSEEEVDRVLEKILDKGLYNLTREERDILDRARRGR